MKPFRPVAILSDNITSNLGLTKTVEIAREFQKKHGLKNPLIWKVSTPIVSLSFNSVKNTRSCS